MKKTKHYRTVKFSADVIKEALDKFTNEMNKRVFNLTSKDAYFKNKSDAEILSMYTSSHMSVTVGDEKWGHDSEEEFFADYRKDSTDAVLEKTTMQHTFRIQTFGNSIEVSVQSEERAQIESLFDIFEKNLSASKLPEESANSKNELKNPTIFIGHGRNTVWRDLKDHLHEKHGYNIEAYEIGARAGHAIRDILEDMLSSSSFAVLVLTGEDETTDGKFHARQNVIHETGLFQGRIGFKRAIVLLEEGTEEFSNIHGIEQIRFSKNNIKETFGDVIATIKREFPKSGV
jgi:predicted nucleotide-binding protein